MHAHRALDEALMMGLDRRLGAFAAHRPPQVLRLPWPEPGKRARHLQHLVLKDDRPQRLPQRRLERGVLVGDLEVRIDAQPLAPLDVGVDGAALDRPGSHDRHLDRDVLEVLGARAQQRLHLRAALDLEDADGLSVLDRVVGRGILVRDAAEVDPLPRVLAISSTQRSTAESIPSPSRSIFRKPASAHESLSHCAM